VSKSLGKVLIWDERTDGHHRRWVEALLRYAPETAEPIPPTWFHDPGPFGLNTNAVALLDSIEGSHPNVVIVMESHALVRSLALRAHLPHTCFVFCDLRCTQATLHRPDAYRGLSLRRRLEARASLFAREILSRRRNCTFGYLNNWALEVGSSTLRASYFAFPDPTEIIRVDPPRRSDPRFTFLTAGALTEHKGADLAVDALRIALELEPALRGKLRLRLAGRLSDEASRRVTNAAPSLAALDDCALSVDDRLLTNEELATALTSTDVLLLPYRQVFGSSGMLSTSVALRPTRVIASDFGWLGHVVDASGGWTFRDSDPSALANKMVDMFRQRDSDAGQVSQIAFGFGSELEFAQSIWAATERVVR
jgi:glycosyltransferase involved in cell wall biosynthesis